MARPKWRRVFVVFAESPLGHCEYRGLFAYLLALHHNIGEKNLGS